MNEVSLNLLIVSLSLKWYDGRCQSTILHSLCLGVTNRSGGTTCRNADYKGKNSGRNNPRPTKITVRWSNLTGASKKQSKLKLTAHEQTLYDRIDRNRLPRHIAIIMDGNGRWAKKRNYPRIKGHKAAIPSVQNTVEGCVDLGIPYLTVYAFSTENWKRPANETGTLMALLRQYFRLEMKTMRKHQLRIKVLGAIEELSSGIQKDVRHIVETSSNNTGMTFNVAINYSGRGDILCAFRKAVLNGEDPQKLNETAFSHYLSTGDQPDPDLVIRTSGEMRISNFLLWQIAYSEIWTTPTLWPDFRKADLYEGILDFQSRNRRFGGI